MVVFCNGLLQHFPLLSTIPLADRATLLCYTYPNMHHKSVTQKGIAALVLCTAIFASLSVVARYLNTDFTILQQVYLRVFAALLIALVVFRKYLRWDIIAKLPAREWAVIAFRGLVGYGIGVTLISQAATMTLLGNVSFIAALPFVPLLGFLFLKEKVTWWKLLFVTASLLGVMLLSVHDWQNLLSWGTGELLAIIASLAFAIGYVTRRWHAKILNNQEITTLTFVCGTAFLMVFSLVLGEGLPKLDVSWGVWLTVILGGVFNVANLFFVNYGFEHVDAVRAGNLLNLESAWGLLFGFLLYQEWPTWLGLLGGIIIVASVVGMNWYSNRAPVTPPKVAEA